MQLFPEYVPQKLGFIEEYLFSLATEAVLDNVALVAVFSHAPATFVQEKFDAQNIETVVLSFINLRSVLKNTVTLLKIVKKTKINIVDIHFGDDIAVCLLTFLFRIFIKKRDCFLIRHQHNTYGFSERGKSIKRVISRLKLGCLFFDKIIAVSQTVVDDLMLHGIKKGKIICVYNGIHVSKYEHLLPEAVLMFKEELKLSSEDKIVTTIAYACPMKGLQYFIDAVPAILNKVPNTKFLIVGGGPLSGCLQKQASRLGIEEVVFFLGVRKDIPVILSSSDVSVLSSVSSEGLPTVILESLCCRVPVVATDMEQCKEIITDSMEGLLVPTKNSQRLAEAIVFLLENEELAESLAKRGYKKVVKEFTIDRMIAQTFQIYKEYEKA